MVIGDLDVVSVAILPNKADSPLIVYSDAVLTRSIALQEL
jgi:hypothetical protein